MSIVDTQLDRICRQQTIEDVGNDVARSVFRAACRKFRKWLSPVRQPAAAWIENVEKMLILCRLEGDAQAFAELLAIRAAAQIDATVQPGDLDDLALAAGLDVLPISTTSVGPAGSRVVVCPEGGEPSGGFTVILDGWAISVPDASIQGRVQAKGREAAAKEIDRLASRNTGGSRYVENDYGDAPAFEGEMFDTVHDPWRASRVYSPSLKAHPTQIIEPATLAATPYPAPTYRPLLPAQAIERGFISDAQFETIVYALQATDTYLPGCPSGNRFNPAPRGGFIIGDGTGVGKTNEMLGIVMDQWLRGVKRHIVVVEREKHYAHIKEAWEMLGGSQREIVWQGSYSARDPLPDRDCILVTSYALIRGDEDNPGRTGDDRYRSLIEWATARGDFHGVLAFDEAHNMRNAVEDVHEEGSGKRNQSQQGKRGIEIQEVLPHARVLYLSATMATDVYNLGYAPRLGLWGHNAPFPNVEAFVSEMHELDEAALEQICIDLKAAGRYCSRNLSFDGVEYDEVVHRLTTPQRAMFDNLVTNWRKLDQLFQAASKACLAGQKGTLRGRGVSRMRRLTIEQMLASFNTDTLIEDIHAEIARGHAPVVQIAFTGEARLRRMADGRNYIPESDYVDKEIIAWVEKEFPEVKMIASGNGIPAMPQRDANGDPIPVAEAKKLKEEAMKLALEMSPRHSPLDKIYRAFGEEMIAEMTGRSLRALPEIKGGQLVGWNIEERNPHAAIDDVKAFEDGRKRILVFSLAAGGTGLSYHAARKIKNRSRRVHYIHELGQRAEQSVQGLGRTHRSDQESAPIVKLVCSDVPAHTIYASRTLTKISKMGALSRGHQHATTNAIFDQRVPLTGIYAQKGWLRTLFEIQQGKIEGITTDNLASDLKLKVSGEGQSLQRLEDVIMRLATLTDGNQRALIDRLVANTEEEVAKAIRAGTFNQGLETIRASSIEIIDENRIENANGSSTTYYRLRKREEIERLPFKRANMLAAAARAKKNSRAVFMRHKVNGRIVLGVVRDGPAGIVDIYWPGGTFTRTREMLQQEPWKVITDMEEAERMWELESETLDIREISDIHILSGSLLYNWDKLPKRGVGLNRCKTDDGKVIVGRVIHASDLRQTLQGLGMRSNYRPAQIAKFLSKVEQGAEIEIDNGWKIVAPFSKGGDYRLIVPDAEQTGQLRAEMQNLGVVAIDTPLGLDLEIPRAQAIEVIQAIAIGSEISLTGVTTQQSAPPAAPALAMPVKLAACK